MGRRHMKKLIETCRGKYDKALGKCAEFKVVNTYVWVEKYGWKLKSTEPYEGAEA